MAQIVLLRDKEDIVNDFFDIMAEKELHGLLGLPDNETMQVSIDSTVADGNVTASLAVINATGQKLFDYKSVSVGFINESQMAGVKLSVVTDEITKLLVDVSQELMIPFIKVGQHEKD